MYGQKNTNLTDIYAGGLFSLLCHCAPAEKKTTTDTVILEGHEKLCLQETRKDISIANRMGPSKIKD